MHSFLQGLPPTASIAHRGGAKLAPENTLLAFRQAIDRYGCEILELDLQATADGALVVFHDETLDRCTDGRGPIARRTLAELRGLDAGYRFSTDRGRSFPFRGRGLRIPTLEEVLEELPTARLHIELKPDRIGLEQRFAEIARPHAARLCVGSGRDRVAARLLEALPEACHFYPRNALLSLYFAWGRGRAPAPLPRFEVVSAPLTIRGVRVVGPALVEALARMGKWLNVWTVDREEEMRRLIAWGVGGIMSDRPDRLQRVLAAAARGGGEP